MKLAFTTLGCPGWTVEQIAEKSRVFGFDGVELRTSQDGQHLSAEATLDEAKRISKLFSDAGVPVMSLMGYTTFAHLEPEKIRAQQALMRKQLALAEAMRVPFVRTFAGRIPSAASRDAMVEAVARALKPLAAEAADRGLTIGLETHDDWCTGTATMAVVDQVGRNGIGIVFDIGNVFRVGAESWEDTYCKIRSAIAYCHVKDSYIGPDGTLHYVPVGAGDLPWSKILSRFKQDGFSGFFSLEWEKKWHPELPEPEYIFPHYVAKMRQIWQSV